MDTLDEGELESFADGNFGDRLCYLVASAPLVATGKISFSS